MVTVQELVLHLVDTCSLVQKIESLFVAGRSRFVAGRSQFVAGRKNNKSSADISEKKFKVAKPFNYSHFSVFVYPHWAIYKIRSILRICAYSWQNKVLGLKIHYPRSFIRFDIPKSMVLRVSIHKNHNGGCFWENFILSKCWKISYFEPMMCICHHFKAKSHFKDPLLN